MKPLIIGQAPGPNTNPNTPLHPKHYSGRVLCEAMGLQPYDYLRLFERTNLLGHYPGKKQGGEDRFPIAEARVAARALRPLFAGRQVILLGRNVADAFHGYGGVPFLHWHKHVAVIPHPSGRNRWWNDPTNQERVRDFLSTWVREIHRDEIVDRILQNADN